MHRFSLQTSPELYKVGHLNVTIRDLFMVYHRLVKLEQEVESKDEIKNKLELSVELEKTKATSLQEDVDRLNQLLADTNVSFLLLFLLSLINKICYNMMIFCCKLQ